MNFRSEELADAIGAGMPHQTLIDMLDEFEGTIPPEHAHFFECLSGEIRLRLSDIREEALVANDVDRLPDDEGYQVEWEGSPAGGLRWRMTIKGSDCGPTLHRKEQFAVEAAWADYVEKL